jgi:hypothetical protein
VVVPAAIPVTTPEAEILATAGALLVHIPPIAGSVIVIVVLVQTVLAPVMVPAFGKGLTVTTWVE